MQPKSYKQKRGYVDPELLILNNPSSTGYGVTANNRRTAEKTNTWNAALIDNANRAIKMWAYEVEIDFGMSGTTSQSRYRRQFFPRSFNQTNVSVKGQMPNQEEYNKLAAFVRESHSMALNSNNSAYQRGSDGKQRESSTPMPQLLKLYINPYEPKGKSFSRTLHNPSATSKKGKNIKGPHQRLVFDGYIKNIATGAQKFDFAPEFQFSFVVAQAYFNGNVGLYDDTLDNGSQIMNWTSQIEGLGFGQRYNPGPAVGSGSSSGSSKSNAGDSSPVKGPSQWDNTQGNWWNRTIK